MFNELYNTEVTGKFIRRIPREHLVSNLFLIIVFGILTFSERCFSSEQKIEIVAIGNTSFETLHGKGDKRLVIEPQILDVSSLSTTKKAELTAAYFVMPINTILDRLKFEERISSSPAPLVHKPKIRPKRVLLYAQNDISSDVITSVNLDRNSGTLRVHGSHDDALILTEVSVSGGIPIWVRRELTEKSYKESFVKISARVANAFSVPSTENSTKLGLLMRGEEFKVIRTDKDWIRIWSPPSFRAWAKTEDLTTIFESQ